jgi:TetR/AcrR family transcriptional regulator
MAELINNKEKEILEAAEEEFMSKGFDGAKTQSIAKAAGVTHAMLHYYFRTKEHLFEMVFENKVSLIAGSFVNILDDGVNYEDAIEKLIRAHFRFLKANPRLINFVLYEVRNNKERRELLFSVVSPLILKVFNKLKAMTETEIEKGTIRAVDPLKLLENIISVNLMTFIIYPIARDFIPDKTKRHYEQLLKEKEDSNVDYILHYLHK